jgi:hypothetical protein
VPEGICGGQAFLVQFNNGGPPMQVTCPVGLSPGDQFKVANPAAAPMGMLDGGAGGGEFGGASHAKVRGNVFKNVFYAMKGMIRWIGKICWMGWRLWGGWGRTEKNGECEYEPIDTARLGIPIATPIQPLMF